MNRVVSACVATAVAIALGGSGSAENEPGLPPNPIPPEGGAIVLEEGPQTMTVLRIDEDANELVALPVGGRERTVEVDRSTRIEHGQGDAAETLELGDLATGDTIVVLGSKQDGLVGSKQDGRMRALSIELVERGGGPDVGAPPRRTEPPSGP